MDINEKIYNKKTLGELLLEPTKIYVKPVLELLKHTVAIKGMVHITGGGFYDNLPRVIKNGLGADIFPSSFYNIDIFDYLINLDVVDKRELYRVFNMGVGFCACSR